MTENRQARTLQNSENFVLSQNGGKKIFFGKIICSTHQKKHFYNILHKFWKIEFLKENRQAQTLQNSENFVLSQNGVRKYFLAKLFVPLIKRNISATFEAVFGKNEFLMENRQARTLQNSENFVLSQNGVRKYSLAKLFVPLIKRNISTTFRAVFGKLNF